MELLHPAMLGGAALAAVPVILHLIMQQKPRRMEFPALRLLHRRRLASQRKLRLRHLLLLALRVAAICLLALALARPSMRAAGMIGDREAPVAAALVFDASPRMMYRHQNRTRLEVAQQIATQLIKQFPAESQIAVIDSRRPTGVFQVDAGAALERVGRLETSPAAESFLAAVEEALKLLETAPNGPRELYLFTDLSHAAWDDEAVSRLQQRFKRFTALGIYVVDLGVESPQNLSLGSLQLSAQVLSRTSPLVVSSEVLSQGIAGERALELFLIDKEGKPQKRSQELIELTPGQPAQVVFSLGGLDEGTHQGFVRFQGDDALPIDDQRYFTVEVGAPWQVLIAAPAPVQLRANYLAEALSPDKFRKQGLARFECEVIPFDRLPHADLSKTSAVCLLDPPPLELEAWHRLAGFCSEGGGLAIFAGRRAEPAQTFDDRAEALLPAPLTAPATGETYLVTERVNHPICEKFRALSGTIPWEDFPVARHWGVGALVEGAAQVLAFRDGSPALLERPVGRGKSLLMTTSISDLPDDRPPPWNVLLSGIEPWPFFMLSNEMLLYLVGSTETQLNYAINQPATLRLARDQHVENFLLVRPSGDPLRQSAAGQDETLRISGTDLPGNYRVRSGPAEGGLDRGFSVNLPLEATELARIEPDALRTVFGELPFQLARDTEQIERSLNHARVGRELYGFLILLVAAALGVEQVLANRFYREE